MEQRDNRLYRTKNDRDELARLRKIEEAARRMSQAVYEQAERQTDIYSGPQAGGEVV